MLLPATQPQGRTRGVGGAPAGKRAEAAPQEMRATLGKWRQYARYEARAASRRVPRALLSGPLGTAAFMRVSRGRRQLITCGVPARPWTSSMAVLQGANYCGMGMGPIVGELEACPLGELEAFRSS